MFKTRAGGQRLLKQCKHTVILARTGFSKWENISQGRRERGLFSKEEWLSRFRKCCGAPSGYKWNESSLEEESSSTTCRNGANNKNISFFTIFFISVILRWISVIIGVGGFESCQRCWIWNLAATCNRKVNNFSRSHINQIQEELTLFDQKEKNGTKSDHISIPKISNGFHTGSVLQDVCFWLNPWIRGSTSFQFSWIWNPVATDSEVNNSPQSPFAII